jgi:hypothetical protein
MRILVFSVIYAVLVSLPLFANDECLDVYSDRSFILKKLTSFSESTIEIQSLIDQEVSAERILLSIMRESKHTYKVRQTETDRLNARAQFSNYLNFTAITLKLIDDGTFLNRLTQNEIWTFYRQYENYPREIEYFRNVNLLTSSEYLELSNAFEALQKRISRSILFIQLEQRGLTLVPPKNLKIKKNLSDGYRQDVELMDVYLTSMKLEKDEAASAHLNHVSLLMFNRFLKTFLEKENLAEVDLERIVKTIKNYQSYFGSRPHLEEIASFNTYSNTILFYGSSKLSQRDQIAHETAITNEFWTNQSQEKGFFRHIVYLYYGSTASPVSPSQGLNKLGTELPALVGKYNRLAVQNRPELKIEIQKTISLLEDTTAYFPKNLIFARLSGYSSEEVSAIKVIRKEIKNLKALIAE